MYDFYLLQVWPEWKTVFPDFFLNETEPVWTSLVLDFWDEIPFDGLWIVSMMLEIYKRMT